MARGLFLLACLAAGLPSLGHAHGLLRRSSPAAGDTLSVAPRELRLAFSEPVQLPFVRVELLGPGDVSVQLAALITAADSPQVVIASLPQALPAAGAYMVRWQAAGRDGHPVRGSFEFVVQAGAAGLAAAPAATPPPTVTHHDPATFPESRGFDAGSPGYVAVRWLTYIALLAALGLVAFRFLVLPRAGANAVTARAAEATRQTWPWVLGLLLLALLFRLGAQSLAMSGSPVPAGETASMLTRTTWGWGWLLQAAGTLLALIGWLWARRSVAGWGLLAAAVLVLAWAPALSGHAAASPRPLLSVLMDGLHVLGAGGWLGGLLAMITIGIPAAWRLGPDERGSAVAALFWAFSPTALVFAGLVALTGVYAAWLHLGSVPALWQSTYGQVLLIKLGVLTLVAGTGAYNWRRVLPALGNDTATRRLRRSAGFELAVGAVVLLVTAVLVATSPPADTDQMARHDAAPIYTNSESTP